MHGYRIVYSPELLRHFTARFEPDQYKFRRVEKQGYQCLNQSLLWPHPNQKYHCSPPVVGRTMNCWIAEKVLNSNAMEITCLSVRSTRPSGSAACLQRTGTLLMQYFSQARRKAEVIGFSDEPVNTPWKMRYKDLTFLAFTANSRHMGFFPEQAPIGIGRGF